MSELYHYGIKGQKWGIRRYQNEDGSLTAEGKRHYGIDDLDKSRSEYTSRSKKMSYKQKVKEYQTERIKRNEKIKKAENELLNQHNKTSKYYSEKFKNEQDEIYNMSYKAEQELNKYYMNKYGKDVISGKGSKASKVIKTGATIVAALGLGGVVVAGIYKNNKNNANKKTKVRDMGDYDKFEYDKFEYEKFEPKKFEYKKFRYKKFGGGWSDE